MENRIFFSRVPGRFSLIGVLMLLPLALLAREATIPSAVASADLMLELSLDPPGYHLWIRQLEGTSSVMLTESQRDPAYKLASYALRLKKFNPINGWEQRILDNRELKTGYELWSVIDSTTEMHPILGRSFHLFLEPEMVYGYSWAQKEGVVRMRDGVRINLRSFLASYCDYAQPFTDQWLNFSRMPAPKAAGRPTRPPGKSVSRPGKSKAIPLEAVDPLLVKQGAELASSSGGILMQSAGRFDPDAFKLALNEALRPAFKEMEKEGGVDVVFVVDSTQSMQEEIPVFQDFLPELLKAIDTGEGEMRLALISYRDYQDSFLVRNPGFVAENRDLIRQVNRLEAAGGREHEEALYEAIISASDLDFRHKSRFLLLLADAPAHSGVDAAVSMEDAFQTIDRHKLRVSVLCISNPQRTDGRVKKTY